MTQSDDLTMHSTQELLMQRVQAVSAMVQDIPSPCVSVCQMDAQREFCVGCWRTLDEIRQWSRSSDAQKKVVWTAIAQRLHL